MQQSVIRSFDILLSILGICVTLPAFIVISLLGLVDTGSPFFFQSRVGRNQRIFTLVKFRTMNVSTQSVGTHLVDAASITSIGKILRRTKLDELPQLFNVLIGQMSLVGPRPCLPNQLELIAQREQRGVFDARPGITGIAQINAIDMSTPRKLAKYDRFMIQTMNLGLYLQLISATALGRGRGDRVRSE